MNENITDLLNILRQKSGLAFELPAEDLQDIATAQILKDLIRHYQDSDERCDFFKDLLLGQLTESEILSQARRYHISNDPRACYLFSFSHSFEPSVLSILSGLTTPSLDFFVEISKEHLCLVHTFSGPAGESEVLSLAHTYLSMLSTEAMIPVKVSYSLPTCKLSDLPTYYRRCQEALSIGDAFCLGDLLSYESLDLEKLIYHLPKEICLEYLQKHFSSIPSFDQDTSKMLQAFFDHDLNLAETAKALYIHRNTLLYRLDKFQKTFGLDVRKFSDALVCKLALIMVEYTHENR